MDGGDVAVAPGTSLRPRRRCRRSPRNIARPGYGLWRYVRRRCSWATSGGEMDGGDVAVAQEHRYVRARPQSWATSGRRNGRRRCRRGPGTSPGRATGYGATSGGDVPGLRPGGEMDGGDVAVAQEHRYVRPAAGSWATSGRRNGRRRHRRSPGTSLRPGAAAILGYVRAAKWTGYSTSGGEMDGGDVAVAQEHRYVRARPDPGLRPGGEMDGGDIAAAQEHRYVRPAAGSWATSGGEMDGGDVDVAPGTSLRPRRRCRRSPGTSLRPGAAGSWATSGRRNGRRRCRRSPRNIATSGRGRNPGLRPAAKWTAAMSP